MPGILCEHCVGYCCGYIALPIDEPGELSDYDDIRWYLLHEGVAVFVEDGEWYINIQTTCRHLRSDFMCGIYETRPQICRNYSTDNCDYHSGDYGWEQHFTCPEHLDQYIIEHVDANYRPGQNMKKGGKGKKRGKPRLKAHLTPFRTRQEQREAWFNGRTADVRGVALPVLPALREGKDVTSDK